jgi:hypothetical protein
VDAYFDMPVFLDYYLFIELMLASDNHGKNTYLSVYDQTKSPKLTISPWDCDGTWGRRWEGSSNLTGPDQDFDAFISTHEHAQNYLYLRLKSLNYNGYRDSLKNRYKELRATWFSHTSLMERFERYHEQFVKSGAALRERNKWGVGNFTTEMEFLSTWIMNRLSYLDYQYLGGPYIPDIPTSIENQAAPGRMFTPNPVRIFSLQGAVIDCVPSNGNEVSVDMSRYAPGVYLLKMGNSVSKIVKK